MFFPFFLFFIECQYYTPVCIHALQWWLCFLMVTTVDHVCVMCIKVVTLAVSIRCPYDRLTTQESSWQRQNVVTPKQVHKQGPTWQEHQIFLCSVYNYCRFKILKMSFEIISTCKERQQRSRVDTVTVRSNIGIIHPKD